MSTILTNRPGFAVALADDDVVPAAIAVEGWSGFDGMACILTAVGLRASVNAQFQKTLRRFIYVYAFGDDIGDVVLSGLAFNRSCNDGSNGLEALLQFYSQFRMTQRETPVAVAIGRLPPLSGFLVDVSVSLADASYLMAQFTLSMKFTP